MAVYNRREFNMTDDQFKKYLENHGWRSHEELLNIKHPKNLHKFPPLNAPAYAWLILSVIIALIVLLLLIYGFLRDKKRAKRVEEQELEARRSRAFHQRFASHQQDPSYGHSEEKKRPEKDPSQFAPSNLYPQDELEKGDCSSSGAQEFRGGFTSFINNNQGEKPTAPNQDGTAKLKGYGNGSMMKCSFDVREDLPMIDAGAKEFYM